jgi:F-type H+-transporting ATPase subunit a
VKKKLFNVRTLLILLAIIALFVVSGWLGLEVPAPVVSIKAEPLFHIGDFTITNSLFTTWIVMVLLIVLSLLATRRMPKDLQGAATADLVPGGLQNLLEFVIEALHGLTKGIAGAWTPKFFPIIATIFLLVITANWLGLIPGVGSIGILEHPHEVHGEEAKGAVEFTGFVANGSILTAEPAHGAGEGYFVVPFFRSPSADLNFTLALALISVFMVQYFGIKGNGAGYFKKFFDVSGFKRGAFWGFIGLFVSTLELISEIAKIISFSFRLFGNVFAGEVLLLVMAFLIPYIISIPFYGLELFVGFIQALVFMLLTLVFFTLAASSHHGGGEEHH